MFVQTEITPNPNSLKFLPGKNVSNNGSFEITQKDQTNNELVKKASEEVIVLHCLPAHRDKEITNEVIESEKSRIFEQAENRMHVQNAIMIMLSEKWK